MKPEPLKGKIHNFTIISSPKSGWVNKKGISVVDITSAVEWLRERIKESKLKPIAKRLVLYIIDLAFEDVTMRKER